MKIKLKKEGGFMGLSSNADLDIDKLSDEERAIINDIMTSPPNKKIEKDTTDIKGDKDIANKAGENESINKASEKNTPNMANENTRGMTMQDAFSYEIKMKKGSKYVSYKFDDKSIPEKVYEIFQKYISDVPSY